MAHLGNIPELLANHTSILTVVAGLVTLPGAEARLPEVRHDHHAPAVQLLFAIGHLLERRQAGAAQCICPKKTLVAKHAQARLERTRSGQYCRYDCKGSEILKLLIGKLLLFTLKQNVALAALVKNTKISSSKRNAVTHTAPPHSFQ